MGNLRRRAIRLFALTQYGFPFLPGRATSPVERLRRLSGPERLPKAWPARAVAFAVMLLGWPVGALYAAIRLKPMPARTNRLRQIIDIWWLALSRNVPPVEYRSYGLDDPAARSQLAHYLFWTDLPAIAALNARCGAEVRDVQDKVRFSELCDIHGLPAIPILAAFRAGEQIRPAAPFVPEQPELWVKSLDGSGGQGAMLWRREGDVYCDTRGSRMAVADFARRIAQTDCLVQPRLANHPQVEAITNGALASLRIVTGLAEDRTSVVGAVLYLPSGNRITSIAGIACAIDPASAILTRALDLPHDGRAIEHHPDTGHPIVGRHLPFWLESRTLVTAAHRQAFGRFLFLGWDVALTVAGPVLIEANAGWSALHIQRLNGPLGLTDFARVIGSYV